MPRLRHFGHCPRLLDPCLGPPAIALGSSSSLELVGRSLKYAFSCLLIFSFICDLVRLLPCALSSVCSPSWSCLTSDIRDLPTPCFNCMRKDEIILATLFLSRQ